MEKKDHFPTDLKTSMPKLDKDQKRKNYRPVLLLSYLKKYLKKNKLLANQIQLATG